MSLVVEASMDAAVDPACTKIEAGDGASYSNPRIAMAVFRLSIDPLGG